jgi:hypothetical protein
LSYYQAAVLNKVSTAQLQLQNPTKNLVKERIVLHRQ